MNYRNLVWAQICRSPCADQKCSVFSERELTVSGPSVVCYVDCLSVTLVRRTQAVDIFGNISAALGTLAMR